MGPEGNSCLVYTCMIMPFTFAPNRTRPLRRCPITKVGDNGLVIQLVSIATTQPAEATKVIFIMEFSRLGLIAVFVLLFGVSARANSQRSANINHTNHMLLFLTQCWNVSLFFSIARAHLDLFPNLFNDSLMFFWGL